MNFAALWEKVKDLIHGIYKAVSRATREDVACMLFNCC